MKCVDPHIFKPEILRLHVLLQHMGNKLHVICSQHTGRPFPSFPVSRHIVLRAHCSYFHFFLPVAVYGIPSSVSSPSSHAQIFFKFMFMSPVAKSLSPAGYVYFKLPVPELHWHAAFLFCHLIANFYFQTLTCTALKINAKDF